MGTLFTNQDPIKTINEGHDLAWIETLKRDKMKTKLTLGQQFVALKDKEQRKKQAQSYRAELIKKYGQPNSPDR